MQRSDTTQVKIDGSKTSNSRKQVISHQTEHNSGIQKYP